MSHSTRDRNAFWKYRLCLGISLGLLVPAGYLVRFAGPGPEWLNDALGTFAYEVFWIALVALVFPRWIPRWIAVGVFVATCGIEFLQLLQSPFWQAARSTFVGRLVLGNTFTWADFPAYALGSALGWGWVCGISRLTGRSPVHIWR
ncbi:MAG: DUF2809 domain-containing protein [Cyanobacteria bacterium P01_E01_bin.6]